MCFLNSYHSQSSPPLIEVSILVLVDVLLEFYQSRPLLILPPVSILVFVDVLLEFTDGIIPSMKSCKFQSLFLWMCFLNLDLLLLLVIVTSVSILVFVDVLLE